MQVYTSLLSCITAQLYVWCLCDPLYISVILCLSVCLSVYLSVCLSVCPYLSLSLSLSLSLLWKEFRSVRTISQYLSCQLSQSRLRNTLKKHILAHFNKNIMLHPNQSWFRDNHSCHTALTSLVDQWLSTINKNRFCGVLFVDFAKAFDVIDLSLIHI